MTSSKCHNIFWKTMLPLLLLVGVATAQLPMPLNDISKVGLGMMNIPTNSTIARTVIGIGDFFEGPRGEKIMKKVSVIMEAGLGNYMEKYNHTVSSECMGHMEMTLAALMKGDRWALGMIDAMGKPRSDLMDLHIMWLGAYEECIKIKAQINANLATKADPTSPFKGRYCKASLIIGGDPAQPRMIRLLTIGLCVPSTCNADDIKAFASMVVSLVPVNTTAMPPPVTSCQSESLEYTSKAIAVLTVCAVLGAVIVIATIYDVVVNCFLNTNNRKVEPLHGQQPQTENSYTTSNNDVKSNGGAISNGDAVRKLKRLDMESPIGLNTASRDATPDIRSPDIVQTFDIYYGNKQSSGGEVNTPYKPGKLGKILISFSLYTNLGKIMNTSQPSGTLTSVHGIRFISMSWVILGHNFSVGVGLYEQHVSDLMPEMYKRLTFHAIGNATFAVDTFFLLSGLLVSYLTLKELKKVKGVRHFNWFMYYFHRFWRLTPPYMLVLMVYVPTLKYWSNGPLWSQTGIQRDECKDTWWWNMLYINNLVDPARQCMGWGWYLANDMQFFMISPFMLIPLYYSRVLGTIACFLFVTSQVVSSAVISWDNELSSNLFFSRKAEQYEELYVKPWCRVGVYAVGMFTGYLLYRTNCKLKIAKTLRVIGWQLATVVALLVLYGLWQPDGWEPDLTRLATAIYNALTRVAWALAISWVILLCCTGQGGVVNTFLSWPGFIPLSRLSYCAYLVHPLILTVYFSSKRELLYYTDIEMAYIFAGNMVLSYAAALLTSLAFEAPMMGLEKVILKREKHS